MEQNVKYNGLTVVPDDYQAPDGDLALSLNLLNEDGALRPLPQPVTQFSLGNGQQVVFVHKTDAYTHYIVYEDAVIDNLATKKLYYRTDTNSTLVEIVLFDSTVTVNRVNAIGNTLVVHADNGTYYFLWDGNATSGYTSLGTHMPELQLAFGLQAHKKESTEFDCITSDGYIPGFSILARYAPSQSGDGITFKNMGLSEDVSEMYTTGATNTVLAKVNAFVAKESLDEDKFIFPFFVRYAYRLFDGSLTMHSSPVLMVASSDITPRAIITNVTTTQATQSTPSYISSLKAKIAALVFDLAFTNYTSNEDKAALNRWADIIQGVELYVSAPIYTYDQAGKVEGWSNNGIANKGFTIACFNSASDTATNSFDYYYPSGNFRFGSYAQWWVMPHLTGEFGSVQEFMLPRFDQATVAENIRQCSNFYHLCSLRLDKVWTDTDNPTIEVDIPKGRLANLLTQPVMTDDYDSHDTIQSQLSYTYNSRLCLAGLTKQLAEPLLPSCYVPMNKEQWYVYDNKWGRVNRDIQVDDVDTTITSIPYRLFVYTKRGGRETVLYSEQSYLRPLSDNVNETPFHYFYYPDANAYKVVVAVETPPTNPQTKYYSFELSRHEFLNGAVAFVGWDGLPSYSPTGDEINLYDYITGDRFPKEQDKEDKINRNYPLPNKLYISEVNNPFFFPVEFIRTIGTGSITAIAAAVKAMSPSQFGQYPLYAFCSDGVWSLSVNKADGTFEPAQPVSLDVALDPDSVTSIDSSVVFATAKGLMHVAGSEVVCISDVVNTDHPFNDTAMLTTLAAPYAALDSSAPTIPEIKPFLQFIDGCSILYDYRHQHIIVFNREKDYDYGYAYVFSRKSRQWGLMHSNLKSVVNAYPGQLAMTYTRTDNNNTIVLTDCKLVSFNVDLVSFPPQLLVSRPFKFGGPDMLKSVHTLIQRGMFRRGDVKILLYGSRDLFKWHLIGSSVNHELRSLHGSPYKYFRIVALSTLSAEKSMAGASLDVEPRYTHILH